MQWSAGVTLLKLKPQSQTVSVSSSRPIARGWSSTKAFSTKACSTEDGREAGQHKLPFGLPQYKRVWGLREMPGGGLGGGAGSRRGGGGGEGRGTITIQHQTDALCKLLVTGNIPRAPVSRSLSCCWYMAPSFHCCQAAATALLCHIPAALATLARPSCQPACRSRHVTKALRSMLPPQECTAADSLSAFTWAHSTLACIANSGLMLQSSEWHEIVKQDGQKSCRTSFLSE